MENSQLENVNPFGFPPYRRRPLQSETYRTLVRILSFCDQNQFTLDGSGIGTRAVQDDQQEEMRECVPVESTGCDSAETSLLQSNLDTSEGKFLSPDEGSIDVPVEIVSEDHVNVEPEVTRKEVVNACLEGIQGINSFTGKVSNGEELALEQIINSIETCFGWDVYSERSRQVDGGQEKCSDTEIKLLEEIELGLLMKEDEFEKLLSNPGAGEAVDEAVEEGEIFGDAGVSGRSFLSFGCNRDDSHPCKDGENSLGHDGNEKNSSDTNAVSVVGLGPRKENQNDSEIDHHGESAKLTEGNGVVLGSRNSTKQVLELKNRELSLITEEEELVDKEIEEGEISGDAALYDESYGTFSGDKAGHEQRSKDVNISNGDFQLGPSDKGDNAIHSVDRTLHGFLRKERQDSSNIVVCEANVKIGRAEDDDSILCSGTTAKQVDVVGEIDHPAASTQDQGSHKAGMDSVDKKRKNRDPPSKERKAKKKKKERMKRAEKNRKLGVKRLKLQPVIKPKKVIYCRHYLKGRCTEGEKCKYSHDTTPLTKSTPCCHFARHSCMKGDDCPFDHELAKYPCHTYASKGFCSRGGDCLFSHEVSVRTGSVSPKTLGPGLNPPSLPKSSQPKSPANVDTRDSHLKYQDTKVGSLVNFSEMGEKFVNQPPKGISFLTGMKSLTKDTNDLKEASSSLKSDIDRRVGHDMMQNISVVRRDSKSNIGAVPGNPPPGINFLSFGKKSSDLSCNERLPCLFAFRDNGAGNLLSGHTSMNKIGSLSAEVYGNVKLHCQSEQISNSLKSCDSPTLIPGAKNSLSLPEVRSHIMDTKKPTIMQCEYPPYKIQTSAEISCTLASSLPTLSQSQDLAAANSNLGTSSSLIPSLLVNTPSSVQKVLHSTLAFAAKLDSEIRSDRSSRPSTGSKG